MRKLRDDSTWNRLTPDQRETLEGWLFDDNLGYAKTLARVQAEFGLEATVASLGRYYRRRARERQVGELVEAQAAADELNGLPVSVASLREAAVKLVGKAVLRLAAEQPEQLDQLASFTKLLLASEDNEIRQARQKLAERYFDYEATSARQKEMARLRAYLAAIGDDDSLTHEAKIARVHTLLFGWNQTPTGKESGSEGVSA
jgi:hypothetical protein